MDNNSELEMEKCLIAPDDYIDNDTPLEMQINIVSKNGWKIKSIKNPAKEVMMAAVKQNGKVLKIINNPPEDVIIEAVKQSAKAISYVTTLFPQVKIEAAKKDGWFVFENPTYFTSIDSTPRNKNKKYSSTSAKKYSETIQTIEKIEKCKLIPSQIQQHALNQIRRQPFN